MEDFDELVALRSKLVGAVAHHGRSVAWFRGADGSYRRTARERLATHVSEAPDEAGAAEAPKPAVHPLDGHPAADGPPEAPIEEVETAEGPMPAVDAPEGQLLTDAPPDTPAGEAEAAAELGQRKVSGITTTFTCLESLIDAGTEERKAAIDATREFAALALENPNDWRSEDAATIYCRARALAPLLETYGFELTSDQRQSARGLLEEAWRYVKPEPGSEAIFELATPVKQEDNQPAADDLDVNDVEARYLPNAYLTYWGLASLKAAELSNVVEPDDAEFKVKRDCAAIWLEKCIGTHVSLHAINSRHCDPQQIAWAICGLVKADSRTFAERPTAARELVEAGLRVFFERQQEDGSWSRGDPLFHYPKAGNAYCYPFETLAELVRLTLEPTGSHVELRAMLRPYGSHLRNALMLAEHSRRPMNAGDAVGAKPDQLQGWCSEHHPHRRSPESWATAGVFKFLQALRRLVGLWTRETAAAALNARESTVNLDLVRERGDTWDTGKGSAGIQLASLFVHPIIASNDPFAPLDPDAEPIRDDLARSAILFGPPGTGKTNLVEAIAGALGWPFVEVTPASFLSEGLDRVSARADEVFDRLMQLDRHVVLFDEIDEMIRMRNDSAQPLERFFTTTMLPRLAKLWKQRRVLFFVNTNSIDSVDPAIRRSQRFDAAIFVLTPSGRKKLAALDDLLPADTVTKANDTLLGDAEQQGEDGRRACWLTFLRYDQLSGLKKRLELVGEGERLEVLERAGLDVFFSDWEDPSKKEPTALAQVKAAATRFKTLASHERRDDARRRVVRVDGVDEVPQGAETFFSNDYWMITDGSDSLEAWAAKSGLVIDASATVSSNTA